MGALILVIIHAALVNNLVLTHLIAVQDQLAFSNRLEPARRVSVAVLVITSVSTPVNYLAYKFVIEVFALHYLSILIYMINIFLIVQLCCYLIRRKMPVYQRQINAFTPVLLFTSFIIGATLFNFQFAHTFWSSLLYGVGTGAGFGLVLLLFTQLRERIQLALVPAAFRELPILFITLAIMSMAFFGFTGIGA